MKIRKKTPANISHKNETVTAKINIKKFSTPDNERKAN